MIVARWIIWAMAVFMISRILPSIVDCARGRCPGTEAEQCTVYSESKYCIKKLELDKQPKPYAKP